MNDADIEALMLSLAERLTRCYALKLSVDVEKACIGESIRTDVTMQARAGVFYKFLKGELDESNLHGTRQTERRAGELREGEHASVGDSGSSADSVLGSSSDDR
jgi:hypothetical protein